MVTTAQVPVERPACDWDSPSNPTLNTWTTVNLAEVFPGVAWPFDASWYHRWQTEYLRRTFRQLDVEDLIPLYEWPIPNFLGFFAGQCAANVALTTAMVSTYQVGGGSSAVEQFFTADEPGEARATSGTDLERARRTRHRFFRALGQLPRASLADRDRTRELAERVAALDTARCSERSLRSWFERVEKITEHTFFHHALTSLGAAEYSSQFGERLRAWVPDLDDGAVTTLTSGLGEVESTLPLRTLWELSRWARKHKELGDAIRGMTTTELREALSEPSSVAWRGLSERFEEFLRSYGFRGQTEYMLALPDWQEDPTFPLNSLRNMASAPDSGGPDQLHETATAHRGKAERQYRDRVPRAQRRRYDELLAKTQKFVRLREFTKANCIRAIRPGRRIMLALGEHFQQRGLLSSRDDVFFLLAQEIDAAIAGTLDAGQIESMVARRRSQKQCLEGGYVLPDNFAGEPKIMRRIAAGEAKTGSLTGLAVSPGVATGTARVVKNIDEANCVDLEPGDILVAPFTDAPWTPLFLVASAVVVETGGLLSHAATIAREFGIPAVVMVKDATRLILNGQTITVDGSAGRVLIH
jgi:pyruvate,water dikinase